MSTEAAFLGRQETECTHKREENKEEEVPELLQLKINQQNY